MPNKYANIACVLTLVTIAASFYMLPRFSVATLSEKQEEFRRVLDGFSVRLSAAGLDSPSTHQRAALLSVLDKIPKTLEDNQNALAQFQALSVEVKESISDLHVRVERLENEVSLLSSGTAVPQPETRNPSRITDLLWMRPNMDDLPTEIRERQATVSAQILAQGDLASFLREAHETRIFGETGMEEPPVVLQSAASRFFDVFKSSIALINIQQDVYIEAQVSLASVAGEYEEFPYGAGAGGQDTANSLKAMDEPGAIHLQSFPQEGKQRVFKFPFRAHPELEYYDEQRVRSKETLFWQLYSATRLYINGSETR